MSESTGLSNTTPKVQTRQALELERPTVARAETLPHLSYGYESEGQGSHLLDYWRVIRKHFWLIVGISIVVPVIAAVVLIRRPNVYEAGARIQVDLENTNPLLGGMSKNSSVILGGEANDPAYFNTQLQILTGPGLLRRVAKNMDLEHDQVFLRDYPRDKSPLSSLGSFLGFKTNQSSAPTGPAAVPVSAASSTISDEIAEAERLSDYVADLQESLKVEPVKESRLTVRETRLIDISYRHTDARLAAKISNAIADTFVSQNREKKNETSSTTGSYLDKRIAELQAAIRSKAEELIEYGKTHQIISLDPNQNTVVERLAGLNKQLLTAENDRKLAEAQYRASLQPGAAAALAEGGDKEASNRVATEAEIKLADLKRRRAELLVENTEKWPAVKEVEKQIAALEKLLNDSRNRATNVVTTNLATRYRQTLATEESLRKAYDQQRAETLTQNEAAVNYHIIQQEIETNKTLLDGLLQRTKENEVVIAGTPNNIRVVDYAIPPKKAVSPRRTLIVGIAFLFALAAGVGLAFFIEYLDDTVRSTEDIENFLRLPSVAVIPQVGAAKQKRFRVLPAKGGTLAPNGSNGGSHEVLLTDLDKRSPVAEAYRHLRTSILLSTAGRPPRTLLITSSVPSEGKTTTAVNTAISLAQTGSKVLIIDADMRRPRIHSIFNLSNQTGLSALLSSEVVESDISEAIQHEERSGLYVLTAGPVPPNPAELIGSEQMIRLINLVSPMFTHVIIDSPPIAAFTDGVLIAAMVEGVLLVVHSGKSSRKVVARARRLLLDVGGRIIGVVLNKAPGVGSNSYYYYSGYYEHYGYNPDSATDERRISA
jgi:capsular exopolysaccharide synthesis family protein